MMIEVKQEIDASPKQVFAVLADGWLYASWVVGASRIRAVDEDWPALGSRIHHSFGVWPLVVDDSTHVIVCRPAQQLTLVARGWPAGEATVDLHLSAEGAGRCLVTMTEDARSGPGKLVPYSLRQLAIGPRNTEALRRLKYLAEGRR